MLSFIKSELQIEAAHFSSYRSDIDGLRALAILGVLFYHLFPETLSGGFVGVDIFFVISGYLISGLIVKDLACGNFRFSAFYARRIRRIYPALIVVMASCLIFGWFVLLPLELKQLGKHVAASAGFIQNFALLNEAGYFDRATELKPLMHLWSLAIEEQFYLLYPLVLWLVWHARKNLVLLLVLLAVLSIGQIYGADPVRRFFLPQTRFWELLFGATLSALEMTVFFRRFSNLRIKNLSAWIGVVLIGSSLCFLNKDMSFPGWRALGPVLGSVALIFAGQDAWVNRKFLAHPVMIFIGLISYPLYLWHWPLISFTHIIARNSASSYANLLIFFASIALACGTYLFIEKPIRFGPKSKRKIIALMLSMILLGFAGYSCYAYDGFLFRSPRAFEIAAAYGEWAYPGALEDKDFDGIFYRYQGPEKSDITFFFGDSNIEQYYVRFDELMKEHPKSTNGLIFKTGGGCVPIPDIERDPRYTGCMTFVQDAMKLITANKSIRTVVVGAQWNNYLAEGRALVGNYGRGTTDYRAALENLSSMLRQIKALGKKVYLVLNIPAGENVDPEYIVARRLDMFPHVFQLRTNGLDFADWYAKYGGIQEDLASVGQKAGAVVIRPFDFLCEGVCQSLDSGGQARYKDRSHLRPSYVRRNVKFLDETVKNGPQASESHKKGAARGN